MGNIFDGNEPEDADRAEELIKRAQELDSPKFDNEYFRNQFFHIAGPARTGGVPLPTVDTLVYHMLREDLDHREKSLKRMFHESPWLLDQINNLVYEDLGSGLRPLEMDDFTDNDYKMVYESKFRLRFKTPDERSNRVGPYTVVVASRIQGEQVLDMAAGLLGYFSVVSISDILSSVGRSPSFGDTQWGWTDLTGVEVLEADVHGEPFTFLRFPQPKQLNETEENES